MNRRIYLNDKFIEFTGDETQSSQNQSFKLDDSEESEKKLNEIMEDFTDESKKNSVYISNIDFIALSCCQWREDLIAK